MLQKNRSNWNSTSISIALVFMVLSLMFGSWLARLPEVQFNLGLGETALGLALLGLPIGAFVGTQLSNWLIPQIGAGRSTFLSAVFFCTSMVLPALMADWTSLFIALIAIGVVNGWMNVSMNAAAANLEKEWNISIMSSCHGMFSLGAMIGASLSGFLANYGVSFLQQQLVMICFMLIGLLIIKSHLQIIPKVGKTKQGMAWPEKEVWVYVIIGFFVMMAEGAIADWSAIMLKTELDANMFLASMGFAGFSLAMAIGRFSGDHLRTQYSGLRMVIIGCFIGCFGFLLAALKLTIYLSILGFFITGIGLSIVVPLLFILAAKNAKQPESGIAAVATAGIVGFLISPPIIGFTAEHYGLQFSFLAIAVLVGFAGLFGMMGLREKKIQTRLLAKRRI